VENSLWVAASAATFRSQIIRALAPEVPADLFRFLLAGQPFEKEKFAWQAVCNIK
jgi:hypothetical protein